MGKQDKKFTERELKILGLLAEGMTKEVIKTSLNVSHVTLEKDLAVLKAKLNAFNTYNLIYLAARIMRL